MADVGGSRPLSITVDSVTASSSDLNYIAPYYHHTTWDTSAVSGWNSWNTALPPITIQGWYDDSKEKKMPEIGGTCCHLCGAHTKTKNTYQRYNKRGTWVSRIHLTYQCGTEVYTSEKNKKKIVVGLKCVDLSRQTA
jgi:hypothetical protein